MKLASNFDAPHASLRRTKPASLLLLVGAVVSFQNLHGREPNNATVATGQPNVIVIYTDDQGYGDVSALNPEAKFQTPNLDRLAAEGLLYTDAHCSDTVCTPSRYGLLTGRYSWRTRLKTGVMGAEGDCLIDNDRMTLANLFQNAGYKTAMVGKWHLGMTFGGDFGDRDWTEPVSNMPLDKGFEYFFGIPASLNYGVLAWFEGRSTPVAPVQFTAKKPNERHSDYRIKPPYETSLSEARKNIKGQIIEVAEDFVDQQCLSRFTDKAIEWIDNHLSQQSRDAQATKPFFLYLPLTSPHYPVCPLPQFHGQGEAGGYGEFIIETDYHIGRLLEFLDAQKLTEDTIVIVTSDNGPENSWKARAKEFDHHSNWIYREGKRSIYEGGHRVPLIIRWPAGIKQPGRVVSTPVCQTDLFATFAELLTSTQQNTLEQKAVIPWRSENAGEDSYSILGSWINARSTLDRGPIIHHAANGQFAIREGKWKLLMPHRSRDYELYNLAEDPSEKVNLAGSNPEVVERLTNSISEIVKNGRSTPGKSQPNDTGFWSDLTWMKPW